MGTWHHRATIEVAGALATDPDRGLSADDARARLAADGPNTLPEAPGTPAWQLFLGQFRGVMTVLLLAATGIALILGDAVEAIAIAVVLLLNGLLGFVNEYRAEQSMEALRALEVPLATVVRDGTTLEVAAADLVTGDVVVLDAGDRVPADGRLIESWGLRLDESTLTGESVATDKDSTAVLTEAIPMADRATMVHAATTVVEGRGRAIVTAIGAATEVGRISELLVRERGERSPLQARLDRLSRYLAVVALATGLAVTLLGVWRGADLLPMLETGLALAIAAVPEGLPAVVTIALALGMRRMAKRNAIVRRLAAVETLGSTNVICTDKTGTLTQNEMTVREISVADRRMVVEGAGYDPAGGFSVDGRPIDPGVDGELRAVLRAAVLCNTAELVEKEGRWSVIGDPTEGALLVAAGKAGLDVASERAASPTLDEVPFDSRRRWMATTHLMAEPDPVDGTGRWIVVKGAPDTVLAACTRERRGDDVVDLGEERRAQVAMIGVDMASRALRVLALATRKGGNDEDAPLVDLTLLGLVGMIDPARPEAGDAVRRCQTAGVRVVMITGDQGSTALAIARDVGIVGAPEAGAAGKATLVSEGPALERIDDAALAALAERTAVFARVSPEQKLRLVGAFRSGGSVVAMTGDGVNDAPALRAADIGVAMGRVGTDVAREAADIVLADDNFATIVAAVEEGRVVFANVRKFVHYLFSCNLSEIVTMVVAVLVGLPLPLLPLQILWLNLVTDVFPALALAAEPGEPGIMERPPIQTATGRPPLAFVRSIVAQGVAIALTTLLAFGWALAQPNGDARATTIAFLTVGFAQLFHVFNSRTLDAPDSGTRLFGNRFIWLAAAITITAQLLAVYLPGLQLVLGTVAPSADEWLIVGAAALTPSLLVEGWRWVGRHRVRP